jgi:hypothetical protein
VINYVTVLVMNYIIVFDYVIVNELYGFFFAKTGYELKYGGIWEPLKRLIFGV